MTEKLLDYEFKAQNLQFQEPFLNILNVLSFEGVDGEVVATFFLTFMILFVFIKALLQYLLRFQADCVESARARAAAGGSDDVQLILTPHDPEEPCPICYELILFPVRTNCRHIFCGECMLVLLKSANLKSIVCPMCRLKVRTIQPVFSVGQLHFEGNLNVRVQEIIQELEDYNVLFSDRNRSFLRNLQRFPVFIRRLRRYIRSLDIFDLIFYNRMVYVRSSLLGVYVVIQVFAFISTEGVKRFASVVFFFMTTTVAIHSVMVLIRRFRQHN